MRLAVLACLIFLTGCTTTVGGTGVPAPTPAVLGFRAVVQTEPAPSGGQPAPSTVLPADSDDVRKARVARQRVDVADPAAIRAALDSLDCSAPNPLRGHDDSTMPLVTCDPTLPAKYVLGPAFLTRSHVRQATAEVDQTSTGFIVNLSFTEEGARIWAEFTTQHVGKQVAVVVDTEVVAAPEIQEAILGGDTSISGGVKGFTRDEAENLAARLASR